MLGTGKGIRHRVFLVVGFWLIVLALAVPSLQAHLLPIEKSLLWEVSRNGKVLGYLFGTYHLPGSDDRFERPMTLARAALEGVKRSAFELDLAEPGLIEVIGQSMSSPDGPYLDRLLGAELFDQALPLLESRGIPRSAARFLKPWAAATILATPEVREGPLMDQVLQNQARDANITIISLERPEEQLALFDNIPLHQQILFTKSILQEPAKIAGTKQRIIHAYLDGDLDRLLKISPDGATSAEQAFNEYFIQTIFARNRRMADRLRIEYARGNLFVAVGALHLPDQQGLVSLLRGHGYDMSPIFF